MLFFSLLLFDFSNEDVLLTLADVAFVPSSRHKWFSLHAVRVREVVTFDALGVHTMRRGVYYFRVIFLALMLTATLKQPRTYDWHDPPVATAVLAPGRLPETITPTYINNMQSIR